MPDNVNRTPFWSRINIFGGTGSEKTSPIEGKGEGKIEGKIEGRSESGGTSGATGITRTDPPPKLIMPEEGFGGPRRSERTTESERPPPPRRLLGDLAMDTPIANTSGAKAAGFTPPKDPRIFLGAKVTSESGGTSGTLVGYSTGGSFIVRTDKGEERVSQVKVAPGQQFAAAGQQLPPSQVYRVPPQEKVKLDALLQNGVGSGKKNVGDTIDAIRDAGFECFIAGGAVRDVLQGVPPRDVDLATTMWIQEADKAMSRSGISTGFTRSEFGTMLVGRGTSNELDVCSLKRGKGSFGFDLKADVRSRDFTINALFYDAASGVILDPCGTGVADAKSKTLRPTCPPGQEKQWLQDNPSAVLRFLKFTLRGYNYTPELLKLVKDNFASSVRGMDSFRRDRQLDSVVPRGDRKEIITNELKRLGFPQSDIDALFGRPFMRSWGDDDDDKPRSWSFGGSSRSGSSSSSDKSDDKKDSRPIGGSGGSSSGLPSSALAGYVGPSAVAVRAFAQKNNFEAVDIDARYSSSAALKLGRLPPDEDKAWSQLFPNGWRKRDNGAWTHPDGSWLQFTAGNVFRGVGKKVFVGRPEVSSGSSNSSSTSSTSSSSSSSGIGGSAGIGGGSFSGPSGLDKLLAANPKLKKTSPTYGAHGKLAVATGHLGRVSSSESGAASDLKKAGFVQLDSGHWEHDDGSWVRFFDGNVFRGHDDDVFTSLPYGPGPTSSSPSSSSSSRSDP